MKLDQIGFGSEIKIAIIEKYATVGGKEIVMDGLC